jgi:hypothetical protein
MVFGLSLMATTVFSAANSGFLGDNYGKLQPGPKGGVDKRWLKPGTDFSKYKKVMADDLVFYLAADSKNKAIDAAVMKKASDMYKEELAGALKAGFSLATAAGPDVLRLRMAITGVKQNVPEPASSMSSTLTIGVQNMVFTGQMSMELMALDSTSNDVVALAMDTLKANPEMKTAKDAFKHWAGRVQKFLEGTSAK